MIYLDNAATTYPKPPEVLHEAAAASLKYYANPGRGSYEAAREAENAVYGARSSAADFFGAEEPENVVFTANCTAAVNYVIKGCLKKGDHVIISDMEHNAVVRPLSKLEKDGIQVTRVRCFERSHEAMVRAFSDAIRRNTRMIFCTHASNVLGVTLPVNEIGRLCRANDLIFGIDAAQSAGVLPLNIAESGADFICIPAHKGMYGVMGLGVLVSSGRFLPDSLIEGGTGSLSAQREQPDFMPDRLESGTLNVPGICAFAAGVQAVKRRGINRIYRHEMELVSQLYRELSRMRAVRLYTPPPMYGYNVPLLSFNIGDMSSEDAGNYLASKGIAVRAGYHCAYEAHMAAGTQKRGTVRVCPSMYTDWQDIEALLRAVREII